ncbi:MAG: glycosyltransferase [Candidatus Bathyarchaeia archaeon]|jgi:UDP-N-acetylglucosamine--N-acetylmuramyl-(pentapeptide) pyrophosphoryl-undecaprenol N-acetylglucosamine transferase
MRLLFSCSELGLGHVSRIIPLGKRLQNRGHEMFFFSGGKAYELLQKEFSHVYKCTPISWYENAYGIITSASLVNTLLPLPLYNFEKNKLEIKNSNAWETIHRYYDLRENIQTLAPDLLIADGDINALRLSQRWHFPSIYIANMIRPSYGFSAFLNPGERLVERYVKRCSKIIIPDNPPPYTISEYSIGNIDNMGLDDKVEYVGSFVDTSPVEGSKEHIFVPISGPPGTRAKMLKILLPVLKKMKSKCIVSLGTPGKKASTKIGNCELHTWLSAEERAEFMRNAKFIIFSGGHATCFETVKYAKPSICIPTQPEQLGNAAKLQNLNCSITVKNKKQLEKAVSKLENDQDSFDKNVLALNQFSNKYKGLDRAQTIVETLKD